MAGNRNNRIFSIAPTSPQPRFTFCADTGGVAPLTVLRTSPASVGIWKTQEQPVILGG